MFSKTKITVRYQETDKMGIVHHSVYPIWFECGRTDFIQKAGIPYSRMESEGVRLPLIGLKCRYLHPSFYEDEMLVKTSIQNLTPTRISFCYEIYRKNYIKPIVTGETEHVWADKNLKPVNMKKYKKEIYELISGIYIRKGSAGNDRE